jgi:hypothetical protein
VLKQIPVSDSSLSQEDLRLIPVGGCGGYPPASEAPLHPINIDSSIFDFLTLAL